MHAGIAEEQGPKSHVFQEDPNAKPLFPSLKGARLGPSHLIALVCTACMQFFTGARVVPLVAIGADGCRLALVVYVKIKAVCIRRQPPGTAAQEAVGLHGSGTDLIWQHPKHRLTQPC